MVASRLISILRLKKTGAVPGGNCSRLSWTGTKNVVFPSVASITSIAGEMLKRAKLIHIPLQLV